MTAKHAILSISGVGLALVASLGCGSEPKARVAAVRPLLSQGAHPPTSRLPSRTTSAALAQEDHEALGIADPLGFAAAGESKVGQPQPSGLGRTSEGPFDIYGAITSGPGAETLDPAKPGSGSVNQVSFAIEGADFDPCLAPDGDRIVFASTQHSLSSDLYIKRISSRAVTQLTTDPAHEVMPAISPDGQRIAFASNRFGSWDIFVMPIGGGKAAQLTSESSHEIHPTWSPDGTRLAFSRMGEASGKWEIWVTDVSNTGVAQFLTYGLFPEWCPVPGTGQDGSDQILFQRSRQRGDRAFSIWTIDYRDGAAFNPTEIMSSATSACINPSWSRNAQWIAFSTVPNPTQWSRMIQTRPPEANLWVISRDGEGLVPLTSGRSVNLLPTWGPEDRLFFVSDRGGMDNIWSLSTTSAIVAATGRAPDWSAPREAAAETHDPEFTAAEDDGEEH